MEAIVWGGLYRFGEAVLAGAPTLLIGLLVAGVFRQLLGPELVFKIFGGASWRSIPQAWMWGMLLPVCSLGVIPIAYEMRRAGLKGGTILAFVLTAPLFNPLSLLYGLTLSAPLVILCFAAGSLLVVSLVGVVWDQLFPGTNIEVSSDTPVPPGLRRLAAVALVGARHLAGPTLLYVIIGLAGTNVLSAIFPHGSLTDSMAHLDPWAPLKMLVVAIPAYATPLNIMTQVGGMFVHGNSVGAAYVLLSLGAGVNLGLIVWSWRAYGLLRTLTFMIVMIGIVLAIAYAIEQPLYIAGDVERPHTHAFDVYACPFTDTGTVHLGQVAWNRLTEKIQAYEIVALSCVATLFLLGTLLRLVDPKLQLESYLARHHTESESEAQGSWLNMHVPAPVLGALLVVAIIATSILGCYVYYPAPIETFEDMRYVKADALSFASSRDFEHAMRSIEVYDDLTRKLQVGHYLRTGELSEFRRARARALRGRLEQLKDILEAREDQRIRQAVIAVSDAHRRLREAFNVDP